MKKILYLFSLFIMLIFLLYPTDDSIDLSEFLTEQISVEVKGEVLNPGIFNIKSYSTLSELLEEVQLTDKSDISSLNLTMTLKNNDVIVIPEKSIISKISINSADLEQLCTVPYIGEKTAQKIIEYRNEYGPFQQIEDLTNIKGIGEKKLDKIRDYICL